MTSSYLQVDQTGETCHVKSFVVSDIFRCLNDKIRCYVLISGERCLERIRILTLEPNCMQVVHSRISFAGITFYRTLFYQWLKDE
jgi:hypothetical protein